MLITIVTVVLNGEKYLEHTIRSVLDQDYPYIEYIIIDGGSTDGTLDIIKNYESRISYWASEPDTGIADAMNKGILKSSGQYLLFLQSDDYLCSPSSLRTAATEMSEDSSFHAFPIYFQTKKGLSLKRPRGFNFWFNFKMNCCHQGIFFNSDVFNHLGSYDTSFNIDMDYEFLMRAYRSGEKFQIHIARERLWDKKGP